MRHTHRATRGSRAASCAALLGTLLMLGGCSLAPDAPLTTNAGSGHTSAPVPEDGEVPDDDAPQSSVCVPVHDDGNATIAWESLTNTSPGPVEVTDIKVAGTGAEAVEVADWYLTKMNWSEAGVTGGLLPDPGPALLPTRVQPGQEVLVAVTLHSEEVPEKTWLRLSADFANDDGSDGSVLLDWGVQLLPAGEVCRDGY